MASAPTAICEYLEKVNRPYSVNDIVTNLNKEYGKTVVQKALDDLVAKNKVMEKIYGKQRVYSIMQTLDPKAIGNLDQEIRSMDSAYEKNELALNECTSELKSVEAQLKKYETALTTAEALKKREKLRADTQAKKTRLEALQSSKIVITNEERDSVLQEHARFLKEYRKRKRICVEIIDAIMETYPKSKKTLLEDIGVETDEDVKFSYKD